jgi:hypothetical protein
MPRALIYIVQREMGWIIKLNGKEFGPSPSREIAVDAAMCAAAKGHERGCSAHIMVHDGQRFRTVWLDGEMMPVQAA